MIGIAGGSGSGKTTFARLLMEALGRSQVSILGQDNYYIDQSHRFDGDGKSVNFDHPEAIDWGLLAQHLRLLKMGHAVQMPIYDFSTHKRKAETIIVNPTPYIILDGILIYVPEPVRQQIDVKIFIETREDVRFERRLKRDVAERGRTPDGVRAQYFAQVKPMHDQFVEPTKSFADKIISGERSFQQDVEQMLAHLRTIYKR